LAERLEQSQSLERTSS